MKIVLDAFFDNNFGDDLFINTVLSRYPQSEFYVFWDKVHPAVLERADDFKNLKILPGNCMVMNDVRFDGYIMVGGDVFMNWGDYSRRIAVMQAVRDHGGFVALQGFSLYEEYCEKTIADLKTIMGLANIIVPRDHASVERLHSFGIHDNIVESADMAFTARYEQTKTENREILGIAPRRKYMAEDSAHKDYCLSMAAIADGWLNKHPNGVVRFLAFSTGEFDDAAVSEEIKHYMELKDRTEIVGYHGNLTGFLNAFQNCTAMLPTRFHAVVFALIYRIPFVAVSYEVKIKQLLNELQYTGLRLPYGEAIDAESIARAVAELDDDQLNREALAAYYQKADRFFAWLDPVMNGDGGFDSLIAPGEFICTSMRAANEELAYLRERVKWLEDCHDMLLQENRDVKKLYYDLLGKTKSFKGLVYLLAKRVVLLFRKEK